MGNVLRRSADADQSQNQDTVNTGETPSGSSNVNASAISGYWNMGPPADGLDSTDSAGEARSIDSVDIQEVDGQSQNTSSNGNNGSRRRRRSSSSDRNGMNSLPELFTTSPLSIDNDPRRSRSVRPRLDLESVEIVDNTSVTEDDGRSEVAPRRSRRLASQRVRQVLQNLRSVPDYSGSQDTSILDLPDDMSIEYGSSSTDEFDEELDAFSTAQTGSNQLASQGILRQALEHVLYHVLEEQNEIRRTGNRDGQGVGDENLVVQLFYYLGTFHVDTSRSNGGIIHVQQQQQQPEVSSDTSGPDTNLNAENIGPPVQAALQDGPQPVGNAGPIPAGVANIQSSSGRITGNFNSIRSNGTLLREVQREWLSNRAMRSELIHFSRDSLNSQDENVVTLPLVMFGAREVSANSANQNGWIMYVIGGTATSNALREIASRTEQHAVQSSSASGTSQPMYTEISSSATSSVDNNTDAVTNTAATQTEDQPQHGQIVGTNGTILMITRNRSSEGAVDIQPPVTANMHPTQQPVGPTIVSTGADGNSLRLIVASLLSGLQDHHSNLNLSGAENVDFLNALNASFGVSEGTDRDTYDLFWSLSNLIGYARPRHVPLADIERTLEVVKYRNLQRNQESSAVDNRCPICLTEYNEEDDMRQLECTHCFHKACIDTWLSQYVNSCPLCRDEAIPSRKAAEDTDNVNP